MKRLCGFAMFWTGFGMGIMCFIECNFWTVVIILGLMLLGYNLFCSC